ncbi:hypothetical protein BGZ76_009373 [Entomortierella beljakovae]|nr:hypothetical protein BGZ76_009373 [Entomortierella beljakovae]
MYSPGTHSYDTLDTYFVQSNSQFQSDYQVEIDSNPTSHQKLLSNGQQIPGSNFPQLPPSPPPSNPPRFHQDHSNFHSTFTADNNTTSTPNIKSISKSQKRVNRQQGQTSSSTYSPLEQSLKVSVSCIDNSKVSPSETIFTSTLPQTQSLSTDSNAAAAMGSDNGISIISNTCDEGYFLVRALHEYRADNPEHLSFDQFQYIKVTRRDVSGWWHGECENQCGWFPSNRVERVDHVYEPEITSEDYDQIRTGLDGVETQFLGEPVTESVSDNMQMEWSTNSSSIRRTRAGQLAFPPSQLSLIIPTNVPGTPTTAIESHILFHNTMLRSADSNNNNNNNSSSNNNNNNNSSSDNNNPTFGYSDFATAVALHVRELMEATSNRDIERYRPLVIGILSFVRDLLIVTNTIARDSDILRKYPALSTTRQDVLRALGNLYSKCEVADGTRAGVSSKKRRLAVEKLGFFGEKVLVGVTEFTKYAQEIGLRMASTSAAAQEDLDIALLSPRISEGGIVSPTTHGRPRRRVSRANSAKGYKSFNAVRQWKTEHIQKYAAAKASVELLKAVCKESLVTISEMPLKSQIMATAIQATQYSKTFLLSAEEIKTKGNTKEDNDYAILRSRLASALIELFDYIQVLQNTIEYDYLPTKNELEVLSSKATLLSGCLVDLDVHSKASQGSQERSSSQSRNIPSKIHPDSEAVADYSAQRLGSNSVKETTGSSSSKDILPKAASSKDTAPPTSPSKIPISPVRANPFTKNVTSMSALSDRCKDLPESYSPLDKDGVHLVPEASYGEGNDLEKNTSDFYRASHDSAVVIMSGKCTPHNSLMAGQREQPTTIPTIDEEDGKIDPSLALGPSHQDEAERIENGVDDTAKGAERKVTAIFVPASVISQLVEEPVTSTILKVQQSVVMEIEDSQTPKVQSKIKTSSKPPTPPTTQRRGSEAALSNSSNLKSQDKRHVSPSINSRSNVSTEIERPLPEYQNAVGLGVSIPSSLPTKTHAQNTQIQGTGSVPRSSGTGRVRNLIPPSPRMEPSKRMPRTDHLPSPNSPNLSTESRAFPRRGSNTTTNLSPATTSGSRRGSQISIRSDISSRRRSNDSQLLKEHDTKQEYERRQASHRAVLRRSSNTGHSLGMEPSKKVEDVFLGPSTPTTPNIQTFIDNHGSQKVGKNPRRSSVASNLSITTDSSTNSRAGTNVRVPSPALRRANNQDPNVRGRLSTESNMSTDRSQHHQQFQQARNGPVSASYRPRQNKVGQAKNSISSESRSEIESPTSPWFLDNDYEPEDVLYNENGSLAAGSLDAFIEVLTSHKTAPEPTFVTTFFTTFRLFTNPGELVHLLNKRFVMPPPSGLSDSEIQIWRQQKQERVQKRVHIALRTWLEGYWVSEKDREAFKPIMDFVAHDMALALPGASSRLSDMLNQWVKKRRSLCLGRSPTLTKSRSDDRLNLTALEHKADDNQTSGNTDRFSTVREKSTADQPKNGGRKGLGGFGNRDSFLPRGPPVPLVNKALLSALANDHTITKVPVTDIKPVELARQLTIIVGKLFMEIPYLELLAKERPNCSRMIQVSNKITIWVTDTIVDELDIKKRIGIIKHWIEVGEECLKLNNFDTLTAISCAIESTPVKRLHNTWEGINKGYYERSLQLKKMVSSDCNYSVYRSKLKSIRAPCIPFLGLYFTVIAYIDDGNSMYKETNTGASPPSSNISHGTPITPTPAPSRKLLRYGRFEKFARNVQEFRDFQGVYELLEVPRLREYILRSMENLDSERSYRKSLAIEPRKPQSHGPGSSGTNGNNNGGGGGQRSSAGSNGQRSSGGNKGLFYTGISSSEMNSNSVPTKLNKLSFFRKSTK